MVVAIIGLLVTIVLVNTQRTRFQAYDAQIQSLMHQVRNAAEMEYSRTESYNAVCEVIDAVSTLSNAGEFGILEKAIESNNGSQPVTCYVDSAKKNLAVSSPLRSHSGWHWCVESAGLSIELDHAVNSSRCQ